MRKRIILLSLAAALTLTVGAMSFFSASADAAVKRGDVTLDGAVNILDATAIQKHAAGLELLSGSALTAADVNADKHVDVTDATEIQRYAVGMATPYRIGEVIGGETPAYTTDPYELPFIPAR